MLRTIAFSALLFSAAIGLGGAWSPELDLTQNAAAECGEIALDDDPCPPTLGCIVAGVIADATKLEPTCTM